jgi:hypothetical protein
MASEEKSARTRCVAGRDESKMLRVAVGGSGPPDWFAGPAASAAAEAAAVTVRCAVLRAASSGDVIPERSGKDIDGREDVAEGTFSHFWDPVSLVSSVVSCRSSSGFVDWCEAVPDANVCDA